MRLKLPTDIGDYLKVDPTSKTGLRWKKTVNPRAKAGWEAGCEWKVPGRDRIQYSTRFRKILYLNHRIIYFLSTGVDPESEDIDHRNRITTENKPENLRKATAGQNQANKGIQSNNTSGFKGVTWDRERKKWKAHIHHQGEIRNLGRYDTKEEAARAYDKAAVKHFGEFAWLNFPEDYST